MTTKLGDLPLKMSIQTWSEDLAGAIEEGLKSGHVKSIDKDETKDYKVFFIRHISAWIFLTVVRRTEPSKIVEFNNSLTG